MAAPNKSEFRLKQKNFPDVAEDNNETRIILRKRDKGTLMSSPDRYNSTMKTAHERSRCSQKT